MKIECEVPPPGDKETRGWSFPSEAAADAWLAWNGDEVEKVEGEASDPTARTGYFLRFRRKG